MKMRQKTAVCVLLGLAVLVGLPVLAHSLRHPGVRDCNLDGARINPLYRVEVVDGQGRTHAFCCLTCARLWLRQQATRPQRINVTDETTGQRIDAGTAYYVRSSVVTTPSTGNRIHAFRTRADADRHATTFLGTVLPRAQSPFHQGDD